MPSSLPVAAVLLILHCAQCLPDEPYSIVWNSATIICADKGVPYNVSGFGILQNPNDSRAGEYMTLFSENLGRMPRIQNGKYINGGIPQLGDLAAHTGNATLSILEAIPDANYSGLAVIDFEAWRPLYEHDYDVMAVYQEASVKLVEERNPDWTDKALINARAKAEWESAARIFMVSLLEIGRRLRPYAHWGYYEFPRCYNGHNATTFTCYAESQADNDELMWLYEASSGLFPSIYISYKIPTADKEIFPTTYVKEAMRVSAKRSTPIPVFPYTQYLYPGSELFLDKDYLLMSYLMPALAGAAGAVIWGGTDEVLNEYICQLGHTYVEEYLGPVALSITEFTRQCSDRVCSGHGRCVTIDAATSLDNWRLYGNDTFELYKCNCYDNYKGTDCSSHE